MIPDVEVPNSAFLNHEFLDENGDPISHSNEVIIEKFQKITVIESRRYARPDQTSKDLVGERLKLRNEKMHFPNFGNLELQAASTFQILEIHQKS